MTSRACPAHLRRLGLTAAAVGLLHAWFVSGWRPLLPPEPAPTAQPPAWHVELRQAPAPASANRAANPQPAQPPQPPQPAPTDRVGATAPRLQRAAALPQAEPAPSPALPTLGRASGRVGGGAAAATASHDAQPPAADPTPAEPLPLYEPSLPEPAELYFDATRGAMRGRAVLRWTPQDGRYELELVITPESGAGVPFRQRSTGDLGSHGLEPRRFVDERGGRGQRAANFRRDERELSFSASTERVPLPDGLQDRLGWLVQIVGVMNARTAADQLRDEPIVVGVAGLRGGVTRWTFDVQADAAADPPAWRLVREPQGPYDTRVELWLDTSPPHWPLRLRYTEARGDALDLVRRAQSATP